MGEIYWAQFDWPSFATIFTGVVAVCGAVLIGYKQAAITNRQASIAANQNDILLAQAFLSEQTLRHELFDRRLKVYMEVVEYIASLTGGVATDIQMQEFVLAMDRSKFLFSDNMLPLFEECQKDVTELEYLTEKFGRKSDAGNDVHQVRIRELERDLTKLIHVFGERLKPEMAIKI